MPEEPAFDTVMKMLRDPAFAGAAGDSVRNYLSLEELSERSTPEGLSTQQLWELLSAIRRFSATTFPIPIVAGERVWYTITVDGMRCLRTIERHCRSDSRLHQMVQRRSGQRFLVSSRIREAIATCLADDVAVDAAELERMLREGRAPRTPEERLVANTYAMLREEESLVEEDFSPELVTYLFERTTHGLDPGEVTRSVTENRGVPWVFRDLVKAYRPPQLGPQAARTSDLAAEALGRICDYANGRTGDPREPVAARGYMLLAAFGYWHPLPDFNATVARHVLKLLSVKQGFPGLGYIPISEMSRRWSLGQVDPGDVRYSKIQPAVPTSGGIDVTAEILTHLQLTVVAIDHLLTRIQSTKAENEAMRLRLRDTEDLNYRQRDVLNRALRDPGAEFTLREHRLSFHTAYSTARADLLELVEMGFLDKEARNLAFVFSPVADLRDRIRGEHRDTE